jgi:hypothetical protein
VRTALGWHALSGPGQARAAAGMSVLIRLELITLTRIGPGARHLSPGARGRLSRKGDRYSLPRHDVLVAVDVAGAGPVQARVLGADPPLSGDEVILTVDGSVAAWRPRIWIR